MVEIPWNDAAVLIRVTSGERTNTSGGIEDEGTLRDVVRRLEKRRSSSKRFKVSFPDRRVPPYEYNAFAIDMLVRTRRELDEANVVALPASGL